MSCVVKGGSGGGCGGGQCGAPDPAVSCTAAFAPASETARQRRPHNRSNRHRASSQLCTSCSTSPTETAAPTAPHTTAPTKRFGVGGRMAERGGGQGGAAGASGASTGTGSHASAPRAKQQMQPSRTGTPVSAPADPMHSRPRIPASRASAQPTQRPPRPPPRTATPVPIPAAATRHGPRRRPGRGRRAAGVAGAVRGEGDAAFGAVDCVKVGGQGGPREKEGGGGEGEDAAAGNGGCVSAPHPSSTCSRSATPAPAPAAHPRRHIPAPASTRPNLQKYSKTVAPLRCS